MNRNGVYGPGLRWQQQLATAALRGSHPIDGALQPTYQLATLLRTWNTPRKDLLLGLLRRYDEMRSEMEE
jgi:hypothetical protein